MQHLKNTNWWPFLESSHLHWRIFLIISFHLENGYLGASAVGFISDGRYSPDTPRGSWPFLRRISSTARRRERRLGRTEFCGRESTSSNKFTGYFFKKWANPGLFCLISLFFRYNFNNTNWKKCSWCAWDSNPGRRMVGADETTELWLPPPQVFFCVGYNC